MNISSALPRLISPTDAIRVDPQGAGPSEFKDVLSSAIDHVELSRANASQGVERFLSGEGEDLHSTILSVQRADLEFEMMMQVRNKVVGAYQEVMRMQM